MSVIDLTDDREDRLPQIAVVARYPPSDSGSAAAVAALVSLLTERHGYQVEVVRLVGLGDSSAGGPPVVMDLGSRWHMSAEFAARRANRCDLAVVQIDRHVPLALVDELISELDAPAILSLDDIGPPDSDESRLLASLAARAAVAVVPTESARRRLETAGRLGEVPVDVIPHGSRWEPLDTPRRRRRRILSWGFLAPGMGAERVVRALPLLADLEPTPRFRILGVTDPGWSVPEADAYRASLTEEAARLGVGDLVEVVPVFLDEQELRTEIELSDVIAVMYDSRSKVSSRILAEAISTGRPVVATSFPAAVELLASGAGRTVSHDDQHDLADALRRYLSDDDEYRRASRVASLLSPGLGCEETARRFASLIAAQLGRSITSRANR